MHLVPVSDPKYQPSGNGGRDKLSPEAKRRTELDTDWYALRGRNVVWCPGRPAVKKTVRADWVLAHKNKRPRQAL